MSGSGLKNNILSQKYSCATGEYSGVKSSFSLPYLNDGCIFGVVYVEVIDGNEI